MGSVAGVPVLVATHTPTMSAARVVIHRGLCGVSLRTQCSGIGATYCLLSAIGIFMSSLRIHSPASYITLEEAVTEEIHPNISGNHSRAGEENTTTADELEAITKHLIRQVGQNAIQMLMGSLAVLICSAMLIHGIRKHKTSWILPWIVESAISTGATFVIFLVRVASTSSISIFKVFLVVVYFSLSIYFILSVHSLYIIMKIQKKNASTFLDQEFEADAGAFYQTLEEDDAPLPPYREKAVPMTEEDDKGKEHVLYARV